MHTHIFILMNPTCLQVFGLMGLYGVRLNAFSVTNLAVAVGMSTELSAHCAYTFLRARGDTRPARAAAALAGRLAAESHGLGTSVLALLFVLSSPLAFVRAYYFGAYLSITLLAYLNGVLLLPALLALVGPAPRPAADADAAVEDPGRPVEAGLADAEKKSAPEQATDSERGRLCDEGGQTPPPESGGPGAGGGSGGPVSTQIEVLAT
jgi:hypothetical protein